jgi:hypothetical protein
MRVTLPEHVSRRCGIHPEGGLVERRPPDVRGGWIRQRVKVRAVRAVVLVAVAQRSLSAVAIRLRRPPFGALTARDPGRESAARAP